MANKLVDLAVELSDFGKELTSAADADAAKALLEISGPADPVYGSPVTALAIASGVVAVDTTKGDYFTLALTANVTSITFSGSLTLGRTLMIRMRQDGTGSRTVALPSSFKAIDGSDTAVQSAANAYTILIITSVDGGTRWEYSMKKGAA